MDADKLLDPSYRFFLDEPSSDWSLATLQGIRSRIARTYQLPQSTPIEQVWTNTLPIVPAVRLCVFRPREPADHLLPMILYIHGGGFILGAPEMAADYLTTLADETGAIILAVDYRLAPEHPFPASLEDCYTALSWVIQNTHLRGTDRGRVAIMGHSAGGGLAAALALLVRNRNEHQITGLVMVYPMLDYRTGSPSAPSDNPTTGLLCWSREANQFSWQCMKDGYDVGDDQASLFSPSLASQLKGLPPTVICIGALDFFLEESVEFALKLSRSGVPMELHIYPGVPHMFDQYPGAITERCRRDIVGAIVKMLAT